MAVSHRQMALSLPEPRAPKGTHGGARKGAGRPKAKRAQVSHRARPLHARRHPVHVTMRARAGLHTFRCQRVLFRFAAAIRKAQREGFRIVHFSIQSNHVHVLIEADDHNLLRSGSQGLAIRLARAFNRIFGREGKIWADRHDRRAVRSPRELRSVLVYVLQNHRRHMPSDPTLAQIHAHALDPLSSAVWFGGFTRAGPYLEALKASFIGKVERCVVDPSTWLLSQGWLERGGGPIHPREAPRGKR